MIRSPKQRKSITRRLRILVSVAIALVCMATGVLVWRATRTNSDATVMTIAVATPSPQYFSDENTVNFITSNGAPDINNNRELNPIQPVVISYDWTSGPYAPTFRTNATADDIAKNVKITPYVRGKWAMRGPNAIVFTPDTDWHAGTRYTVKISRTLLNPDVRVNSTTVSFATPDIAAHIDSFNIYPDTSAPQLMTGIAIISFNYPIDTHDFNDNVSLKLDGKKLDFTVKFDRFHRTAFITSAPIKIISGTQILRMKLNKISAAIGNSQSKKISANATIESVDNFFKISDISTVAADSPDGNARQLILVNTTAAADDNTKWSDFIDAYLLPEYANDSDHDQSHRWQMDEINASVLKQSKKLKITPVEFVNPIGVYQYAFEYDVSEQSPRYVYVRIRNGIKSRSGFMLKNPSELVLRVPYPDKVVKIVGDGALLSMAGDRKLGIMARGGADAAYVNLYKVKSSEINHLISQTYNVFASNMEFKSWAFGVYDMSLVFQKKIPFANTSMKHTNYASIDLGDYLNRGGTDETGIFIVQTGATKDQSEHNDKRLILLTDLGIIRKVNQDGSSDLFVSNLSDGAPADDVAIEILGRNGNALWMGRTDDTGHAILPKLAWSEYRNEKEPVAVVARRDNDVAFIPYSGAYTTHVEYSKFDVDGTYTSGSVPMNAFLFTDRGIYRPGEGAIIAGIVKNKSFKSLAGVPVKLVLRDARGREIHEEIFSLPADGMFDTNISISSAAPIGEYNAYLYSLNSKNKQRDMLGMVSFRVEEFTPDNMKITANIVGATENGWISPDNLVANVSLRNMFGTAAAKRKITAHAVLRPTVFTFPEYKNYTFSNTFVSGTGMAENSFRSAQTFIAEIPDTYTDGDGLATLPIKFARAIPAGTYQMTLTLRGFDRGTGNSVQTILSTRTSNAKYLVGYHANSDLSYINRGADRNVRIIALDNTGTPIDASGLTLRVIKRENLTSLVKDYNDYYKYQTISRDKVISQHAINIPATGTEIALDTQSGGTYFLQIINDAEQILTNIEYYVAGTENTELRPDSKSELQIRLNSTEYSAGDDISVSITAPYAGTGLITIERDKVYAYKWFTATTSASVQKITLPDGFEGTGYINVSFVRDINSRDIFTTPYAYAAAPFSANINGRKIAVELSAPSVITDNKLTVKYETNKDAKLMIFAVNSGILQVAKYKIPNPLAHFFQKAALQVETYQILSLLLPEYKILREFAKTGGGDYDDIAAENGASMSNPFARTVNKPVAFYSGIISAAAHTPGEITFDIPQYFNGAVRVFAVAANNSAIGGADTSVRVQSPIIISAATPHAVAPNDTFNVGATITNLVAGSGTDADAELSAKLSDNIAPTTDTATDIKIPENDEKLWTLGVRATDALGNADIAVNAAIKNTADNKILTRRTAIETLSVRPITPFTTDSRGGRVARKNTRLKNFNIDMYPAFSSKQLIISYNASALIKPLFNYLEKYEYPCTEQLVSRMLPYALAPHDTVLGTQFGESAKKISEVVSILKNRQNGDGSFDLWAAGATDTGHASDANAAYITAYVLQFFNIASNAGFKIPADMKSRATDFLRTYAGTKINSEFDAAAHAFAIYVITDAGYITTGYIDLFEEYANANIKNWESKLMGAYIASAYKILKQDNKAFKLIDKYKTSDTNKFVYQSMFENNIANDAIYAYLHNRYFGTTDIDADSAIMAYINGGDYSAYTSATIIMGLSGNKQSTNSAINNIAVFADGHRLNTAISAGTITATIPNNAKTLDIQCAQCNKQSALFYSIIQQGYPRTAVAASNGIEIQREYYDDNGKRITSANIGDTITAKIFVRSRAADTIANVVIVDLMPGGFVAGEISGDMDFAEPREDRILIYADVPRSGIEFTYNVQLTASGHFQIPPAYAQSMYNPQINATGNVGQYFTVSNASNE